MCLSVSCGSYLGFDVCEQQFGAVHLQQHALTPKTARPVQQLQLLHTVSHVFQLLPIQVTSEQVLQQRDVETQHFKHREGCRKRSHLSGLCHIWYLHSVLELIHDGVYR